jgi:putative endonuclease
VTADLSSRFQQHSLGKGSKFCKKYNIHILVYYELFNDINMAIKREKQLKEWKRDWKLELIRKRNPNLDDLMEHNNWNGGFGGKQTDW